MRNRKFFIIGLLSCVAGLLFSCSTGVEPSPEAALLRITLQAAPSDSTVRIATQTMRAAPGDSLQINIFQGRAFSDSEYAVLRQRRDELFPQDHQYNILKRDSANQLKRYTIFEYYVPPGEYDSLRFGISADFMLLTYGYAYGGIGVPMESPVGMNLLETIPVRYSMNEGELTEINLYLKPFASVERYRDLFLFTPQLELVSTNNLGPY